MTDKTTATCAECGAPLNEWGLVMCSHRHRRQSVPEVVHPSGCRFQMSVISDLERFAAAVSEMARLERKYP